MTTRLPHGLRAACAACALCSLLLAGGCRRHTRKSTAAPNTAKYADNLRPLVSSGQLAELHGPNFTDIQADVNTFYEDREYEIAWTRDGKPTSAASGWIEAFRGAALKGLAPEDYDAGAWDERAAKLRAGDSDAMAHYDVALTVAVMRFVSDLHQGRVAPQHFNFEIDAQSKRLNLPEWISNQAVDTSDVAREIASIEPDSDDYRKTEGALAHYLELAKQQGAAPAEELPAPARALNVNDSYPAVPALLARLALEGDAEAPAEGSPGAGRLTPAIAAALKHYQARHGLTADGKLSAATVKSLNVPMSVRVMQLSDSLERWRWLPEPYLHPRLLVNLPEFLLRGYTPDHAEAFTMRVVVGKVAGEHKTPVFTHMMKYLIFRPFWNVPVDIAKKELIPHMEASPGYLEAKNYEVINNKGEVQTNYTVNRVAHGGLLVREKPGPRNSLGLVKFMFPNQYDIYLHSTPQTYLFDRTRRDYSHGCIRVQHPDELASWVLDGQTDKGGEEWTLEKVQEAMNDGQDNHQVNLKTPLPIVIFYLTAHVGEDGAVDFFDDIYGYDADLEDTLRRGRPYPTKPEPVKPNTKEGDTV